MTIEQIVNFDGVVPQEITVEDKTLMEQVKMIQELEPEEKNMVFKMVDTFLTKKKFKDFFQKNVAALNRSMPPHLLFFYSLFFLLLIINITTPNVIKTGPT